MECPGISLGEGHVNAKKKKKAKELCTWHL